MDWLFGLPLELRLAAVFAFGLILGGQLNRGIYRLAWRPRAIGPWSPPLPQAPARRWYDRIPVPGWIALRRESALHGRGFWFRPALIELATGLGLAALYYFEGSRVRCSLQPIYGRAERPCTHAVPQPCVADFADDGGDVHDFDEQTIPDAITVPGTFSACARCVLPLSRPWSGVRRIPGWGWMVEPLHLTTPHDWPAWLDQGWGLACGLAAFVGWWVK